MLSTEDGKKQEGDGNEERKKPVDHKTKMAIDKELAVHDSYNFVSENTIDDLKVKIDILRHQANQDIM